MEAAPSSRLGHRRRREPGNGAPSSGCSPALLLCPQPVVEMDLDNEGGGVLGGMGVMLAHGDT